MSELILALRTEWTSFGLPGVRGVQGTYSLDDQALPPLTRPLDNNFDWLRQAQPQPHDEWAISGQEPLTEPYLNLRRQIEVALPPSFDTFMLSPDLHSRIRSVTACYLEMPDFMVRTHGVEEGYLFHFLSDQQWCCHWNLYLNQNGEHCVLGSSAAFGFEDDDDEANNNEADKVSSLDLREEEVWVCAPDFSNFIYRFWLENELWYTLRDKEPLTEEQKAYVAHYEK